MVPRISIIIVNYNGLRWIESCITSLLHQDYVNFEIILIDNASTDGSVAYTKKTFPTVKIIENKQNLGFSGGNNVGVRYATGKYILLLNNDTRVDKDFLKKFVQVFESIPSASIVQSKIVLLNTPKIIDTCGAFWTKTSLLYHYGNGKKESEEIYNDSFQVFSVKGASVLIKKTVIDKIGLFDSDTWCYYEETDFCHRALLAGFESWYWPYAKVYHAQGGTSLNFANDFIQFHNFKNKLLSFLKNFELTKLMYILPEFLCINLALSLYWLVQGKPKHSLSLYKAIGWNIINFKKTYKKRKKIQRMRKYSDSKYLQAVTKNPKFSYYISLITMNFSTYRDKKI